MFRRRTTTALTRRELNCFAFGVALTLLAVAALDDDPADAVPAEPAAEPSVEDTTFVPLENCRLFDTRPAFNIGPRDTPLGPDEVHQQQVTGPVGDCDIPANATGVALNVTVVEPTAASFLTVFPYAPAPPDASSLNYLPGSPPTPNKVDVKLSPTGQLGFYNLAGTVHVLADVTGYYTPATLDELQAQIDELAGRLDALESSAAQLETRVTRDHVWNAKVASNGGKVGTGDFTSYRSFTGGYGVSIDVTDLEVPDDRWFTAVASPNCAGYTASVSHGGGSSTSGGFVSSFSATVNIYDTSGAPDDCGFSLLLRVDQPNDIILLPF